MVCEIQCEMYGSESTKKWANKVGTKMGEQSPKMGKQMGKMLKIFALNIEQEIGTSPISPIKRVLGIESLLCA